MKRTAMFIAFFVFVGLKFTIVQTMQITGTVTNSEDKQPLIGAAMLIKGTTTGVNTDLNGIYRNS